METSPLAINEELPDSVFPDIKNDVLSALESIENFFKSRGEPTGTPTGLKRLDEMINGLHYGLLYVIAARPFMGKTTLAINIAEHVAIEQKKPVAVFSLAMSCNEFVLRLLCSRAKVNLQGVRHGFLRKEDSQNLFKAASAYTQSKMHIDDGADLNLKSLREKAIQIQGLSLIVIDHLEHMLTPWKRGEKRRIEIAELAAGLKALAVELKVPVIVIAKLNRDSELMPDGIPDISDLGKYKVLEHYADVIGLLYRWVNAPEEEKKAGGGVNAELIIAKNRDGNTGAIPLTFINGYMRFESA